MQPGLYGCMLSIACQACLASWSQMVTDPGDALMRDMAASGQLQPYRWCNGTLYSPEPDNINIAPMVGPAGCCCPAALRLTACLHTAGTST